MHFKDITFPTPQENLSYDEVLLNSAEKHEGDECLRFWESPQIFVVLGLAGRPEIDVDLNRTQKDNVPVLKRVSGGGTVVQGPGCLNYTLVLSKQKHPQLNDLHASYRWISDKVISALHEAVGQKGDTLKCPLFVFKPLSDLATIDEKKFSGNAQRRFKNHILHHGTILYQFDLSLISRYLKMPLEVPEYRQGRGHADFVTNIPIQPQIFKASLAKVFGASPTI